MVLASTLWLALAVIAGISVAAWVGSLLLQDVSFVDSLWSLFFLAAGVVYLVEAESVGPAGLLAFVLLTVWSLRLALHIAVRNWGQPEDGRYQAIRASNQPNFEIKSLYVVFGLQGLLAFVISAPLLFAVSSSAAIGWPQWVAASLWLVGFVFEAGGDWQLMQFRKRRSSASAVLDSGLWRYTRHPNYFGDTCIWWAYWLFAVAAGGWWTVFSPLLMTFLILKVSGVSLLEKTIGDRRPEYASYIARTSAFFPWPPKRNEG